MPPLLYGLGAAFSWGVGDFAGGIASRRIPPMWTTLGMQLVGTVVLAVALVVLGRWPNLTLALLPWAIGFGVLGTSSLMFLFKALALGPIAVVSPVVAANTALTLVLLVVILGERLSTAQSVAIAVTFIGAMLASTDLRQLRSSLSRSLAGVRFGLVALVGFGIWGAFMTAATREHEALPLILTGRTSGLIFMALVVSAMRSGIPSDRRPRTLLLVLITGVLDTVANVFFVFGLQSGQAPIVVTAAGLYPMISAALAIVLLKERLAVNQYLGIAVVVAGLVGLGLQAPA